MADTLQRGTSTGSPAPARPANAGGLQVRDIVLGTIGAGMVVFAIVLLLAGGERDAGVPSANVPSVTMVQPQAGAELSGPVHIVFDLPGEMERMPSGWGVGDLHIHLDVNGREFMPSARDIERLPNGMYRWTLAGLPAGEHELRLFWAGRDHQPLTQGASSPIRVRAR
jgi:hypothetical protein